MAEIVYNPAAVLDVAMDTVTKKIASLDTLTNRYSSELNSALSNIGSIKVNDVPAPPSLNAPDIPVPSIDIGALPVFTPPALVVPDMPAPVDIDGMISALDVSAFVIPDAPQMPIVVIPDTPTMADVQLPVAPTIDTNIAIPDAPIITMPEMDALLKVELPAFAFPTLPTFDAIAPDAQSIQMPDLLFNWNEPVITPAQSTIALEKTLKNWIYQIASSDTILGRKYENALFARARERDSAETERNVQETIDTWAGRGFSMPNGMMVKAVDAALEEGRLKAADNNRTIMIEMSDKELEYDKVAIQFAMDYFLKLQDIADRVIERTFQAQKYELDSKVSVYNAQISLFNAQNSAFSTLAEVYKTKLDGAISTITAYKTAIEGQQALTQINQQNVEVFKTKIEAINSSIEVYKSLIEGASIRSDMIKNQFDAYRTEVQAYSEKINAEKIKIEAYDAQMRGETAKIGMFESQTRAYSATIQGLSSKADIQAKSADIQLNVARTKITKYTADLDAYKANLQANLSNVQYSTTAFQAQVEGYRSGAAAATAEAEMQSRFADMNARTNIAFAQMKESEYAVNLTNAIQQAQIALDASKAVGGFVAQLAAGALSAAHVSASIGASGSAGISNSTNNNYSY